MVLLALCPRGWQYFFGISAKPLEPMLYDENLVNNIKDSDIIIVGKGNKAIGAIQVLTVTDAAGYETDKYVFSIKKLDE